MLNNQTEIKRPELWTLLLSFGDEAIDVMLYSTVQDGSLMMGKIELNGEGDHLHRVENAVYDNPLLLNDYGAVKVLLPSTRFLVLPPSLTSEDDADDMLRRAFADNTGKAVLSRVGNQSEGVAFLTDKNLYNFVMRTFNSPPVYHRIAPLIGFQHERRGNGSVARLFVNLDANKVDVIAHNSMGNLQLANTYRWRDINDAAFFVLAVLKELEMDAMRDEILLTGDLAYRAELTEILRKYVAFVMPQVVPAEALRLGDDALNAPFCLLALALTKA